MLSYILPFILLILVVVFIHEYGHYYFAKKYGVGVTDFSIGFGQEIFGWNDKSGTRWKICWIPLGGYVKFFGDRNVFSQADQEKIIQKYSEEDREKLFVLKPLYQRVLIVFGGPLANFLLALVIFFSIYTFIGKDFTPAVINEVQKDSPAMVGGLKQNDIILEIDGNKVESIMDVSKFITMSTDEIIDFKVKRSYDELILKIKPWHFGALSGIVQVCIGRGDRNGARFWAEQRLPNAVSGKSFPPFSEDGPMNPRRQEWVEEQVNLAEKMLKKAERETKISFGEKDTYHQDIRENKSSLTDDEDESAWQ